LTGIISWIQIIFSLLALTVCSTEYNYTRPTLTEENTLIIVNGRNPLQEMCVNTFIPNDTKIEGDKKINLITGPNNSGFVYLYFSLYI
jgi:DNA mismatch repair protein MSH5